MQRSIKSIKEERARGTRRVDDDASSLSESEVGLGRREREIRSATTCTRLCKCIYKAGRQGIDGIISIKRPATNVRRRHKKLSTATSLLAHCLFFLLVAGPAPALPLPMIITKQFRNKRMPPRSRSHSRSRSSDYISD